MEKLAPWTKWAIVCIAAFFGLTLLASVVAQFNEGDSQTQQYRKMSEESENAQKDIQRATDLVTCKEAKRTDCDQYRK
jgi:hypothetical protein